MSDDVEAAERIGRYVLIRDVEGRRIALAPHAVAAACEDDSGTLLMLPAGRLVIIPRPIEEVLGLLSPRG